MKKSHKIFYEFGEIDRQSKRVTETIIVKGLASSKKIKALIDTGAQRSLIDLQLAADVGAKLTGNINRVGGLERDVEQLETKIIIILNKKNNRYNIEEKEIELVLTIWPNLIRRVSYPLLLGMDFWVAVEKHNFRFSINLD
ncbi:MAG: hypothetical protein ACTSRZ_08015 [Promethearchaeota archaeon]